MSFWAELKRRNVVKVGTAYLIVAWLLAQFVDVINDPLNLPEWFDTTVLVLLALGFPIAVLFAWIFELTPEGLKVTTEVPLEQSIRHRTRQKLNYLVTGLLALAVAVLVVDRYAFDGGEAAVALVTPPGEPAAPPAPVPVPAASAAPTRQKVAVLPCDNLSPDQADAYFAAGIHEEILNQLAKIRSLLVVARSSVMQYAQNRPTVPQIARELNATAIMECSVRYAGDDVLVTAQLIDPTTDSHVWSESYPGNMSDLSTIFAMQADIAMNIANALVSEFSPAEQARLETAPTDSPEAYARFLAGRVPGISPTQRLAFFEQAVGLDPEFAPAHASIAAVLAQSTLDSVAASATRSWREVEARAAQSAARALALDPNIGDAYGALAILDELSWRWPEALRNYERAFELSPNNPNLLWRYGWFLSFAGRHADAARVSDRALELQPTELSRFSQRSLVYAFAGQPEEARAVCREMLARAGNVLICRTAVAFNALRLGEPVPAEEIRDIESQLGANRLVAVLPQLALLYSHVGQTADAQRIVAELEAVGTQRDIGAGSRTVAALALGDRAKLRQWLTTAVGKVERHEPDAGYYDLMSIRANSFGDAILDEPEFRELRSKLGAL
jgi:TolB-like protein/Flp pilus assembly protein TadD